MSSPQKPNVVPGLVAGALPLLLWPFMAVGLVIHVGGVGELSTKVMEAGSSFYLILLVSLLFTLVEAYVLFRLGQGYELPLLAPVGLALVPWLAGITGSLQAVREIIAAVANVNPADKLTILMMGTSELLSSRLFGAWFSATLLLAAAGGLLISAVWRPGPRPESAVSSPAMRLVEAGAALVLALVALLSASEATRLSEILKAATNVDVSDVRLILLAGADELAPTLFLRLGAVVALVLATLMLGGWRLSARERNTGALVTLVLLGLGVAGTLWAEGQPLVRMTRVMEEASQAPTALAGLKLLPFGGGRDSERVEAVATTEGLSRPEGAPRPWSMSDESLIAFVQELTGDLPEDVRSRSGALGAFQLRPRQELELAVDARLPVTQLRRLLAAGARVGLTRMYLVSTRGPESDAPKLPAGTERGHPMLLRLALARSARPVATEVLLPTVFRSPDFSFSSVWRGEVSAEARVHLSQLPEAEAKSRVLELRGADPEPREPVASDTALYLTVLDRAELEDVAHAVRKARAQGFQVVLAPEPPQLTQESMEQ